MAETSPEYQVRDLAGSKVYDASQEYLGELVDVLPAGGNDVFVVRRDTQELLIPAVKSVVVGIDVQNKRIDVVLPKGLRDIYLPPAK